MKKFIVCFSHTEYGTIEINARDEQEAEKIAWKDIEGASWGNDEIDITGIDMINDGEDN